MIRFFPGLAFAFICTLFSVPAFACDDYIEQFRVQRQRVKYVIVEEEVEPEVEEYVVRERVKVRTRNFEQFRDYCDEHDSADRQEFRAYSSRNFSDNRRNNSVYSYRENFSQNQRDRQPIFNGQLRDAVRGVVSLPFRLSQNLQQRSQELREERQFRASQRQRTNNKNFSRSQIIREEFRSY